MSRAKTTNLTQERLRELVSYDPMTGIFTRLLAVGGAKVGDHAGILDRRGYLRFSVDGIRYSNHRLAWFYVHGAWPPEVDHWNRIRSDNRLVNLRAADATTNKWNTRVRKDSRSRYKGVTFQPCNSRWAARMKMGGKQIFIGAFDTPEEAAEEYLFAALINRGEFA